MNSGGSSWKPPSLEQAIDLALGGRSGFFVFLVGILFLIGCFLVPILIQKIFRDLDLPLRKWIYILLAMVASIILAALTLVWTLPDSVVTSLPPAISQQPAAPPAPPPATRQAPQSPSKQLSRPAAPLSPPAAAPRRGELQIFQMVRSGRSSFAGTVRLADGNRIEEELAPGTKIRIDSPLAATADGGARATAAPGLYRVVAVSPGINMGGDRFRLAVRIRRVEG